MTGVSLMDQRRLLVFLVVSMTILIGWQTFVLPLLLPPPPKPAVQKEADDKEIAAAQAGDVKSGDAKPGDQKPAEAHVGDVKPGDAQPGAKEAVDRAEKPDAAGEKPGADQHGDEPAAKRPAVAEVKEPPQERPAFPDRTIELGSDRFQTGYRQLVSLSARGAAVKGVELNDKRYRTLEKPHRPFVVVGADDGLPRTAEIAVPQLDAAGDARRLNWEVVEVTPPEAPHSSALFRLTLDNVELTKRYTVHAVDPNSPLEEAAAYSIDVDFTFRNLGREPRTINYILQGPTGVPLENVENTQKFRDVVVGFVADRGGVDHQLMAGKTIAEGKIEEWQRPMKFIGVDIQFFAALFSPQGDQSQHPLTRSAKQELIGPNLKEKSEISVLVTSADLQLAKAKAADEADRVTHSYHLFAGPKRDDVLPPGSEKVIDFGTFHWISRPMLALLKTFQKLFGSWGIAIICLTIVVRSAMFPVSIRQARGAAKMQALQPEIAELKKKFGNDKEKMARAQMELFRKHKYNPAAGCLPLFLQLPIFMGLYQSLNHAVDLRLASFLWVDNLAAPDALFRMPFALPFLGNDFNLLPLITIALFIVQQKMFMPPPMNEEQAMQQKMMNFMMVFMGVMFYKVPAGLCVYFIASSLWGMAERKLLPKAKPGAVADSPSGDSSSDRSKKRDDDDSEDKRGGGGLWDMLLRAAEKETSARRDTGERRK
jgi:YidC/Oxa1 family membrane protein insertase